MQLFSKLLLIAMATAQVLSGESVPVLSNPTTIYLTRHGETDCNVKGLVQGSIDVPLNAIGIDQARAAKIELESVVFNAGYSSDLIRAKQTAAIVLEGRGIEVTVDSRLRERGFGPFEGKPFDDYYAVSNEERSKATESTESLTSRGMAALQDIGSANLGKTVFVASHGNLIKNIIAPIIGVPPNDLKIGNLAYAKLVYKEGHWAVVEMKRIDIISPALNP